MTKTVLIVEDNALNMKLFDQLLRAGDQEMRVVNESGLYALIFKSRKAAAKRFKKWVTSEVLPTIRKTGGYNTDRQEPDSPPQHEIHFQHMRDLIDAQQEVIHQGNQIAEKRSEKTSIIKKFTQILIANTSLTDQEIADLMDRFTDTNIPEWVAWQRRIAMD
ncbi:BRO-N domain-containing protein [Magnetovibrio blakemorei]|uniref:Bro-N domain-containing protein n=1 Tax=Magnetovibrio blakemorei TaxID=28181 RepID=A0A1E5Q3C7_9PROT|nr:hypothetical protein BEN30_17035 [Magnetovibrio blakemorei]